MRSAAATFDDDLGFDPPARTKLARKPRATTGKKKQRRFGANRIARFAAIGISAAITVGIIVNALTLQKGHHPAPLFASAGSGSKEPGPAAAASGATSSSDAGTQASKSVAQDVAPPALATKPKAAEPTAQARASDAGDDAIARLLKGGPSSGAGTATVDKTEPKTVLAVQKALAKLGFTVKASGTMGPATKKAIEGFERERHVPVKGEVSHRLTKMLATETGLKVD